MIGCICCSFVLFAQSNYQKSTVVTRKGETLKGFIDHKEWDRNPVAFKFSEQPEGKDARVYTVKEIVRFEIEGKDYFEQLPVRVSMDKTEPVEQLSVGPDKAAVNDTIFLRIISTGPRLNLYVYRDNLKTRYYIKEIKSGQVSELGYRKYYNPKIEKGEQVITDKVYQQQLMHIAEQIKGMNTAELSEILFKTDYNLSGIIKAVAYINGPRSKSYTAKGNAKVRFYAGLALLSSRAWYTGDNSLTEGARSKTSYLPKVAAGMDIFVNPYVRKLMVRMDLSFALAKNKVTKPMGTEGGFIGHTFDQYTLAFSPQIIYNIYNSSKLRVNLGTGININYSSYSNNLYERKYTIPGAGGHYDYEEVIKMEPFWFNIPLRAGLILRDRVDFYAQYHVVPSPVVSYAAYSVKVSTWQAGINILLK